MSIWNHKTIKETLSVQNYYTLDEADTPVTKFFDSGIEVILKREDLNPTASWKDRGTAYKISQLASQNIKEAVISSSGNAAISFLTYANHFKNLKLHIVVSPNTNSTKLERIKKLVLEGNHELHITESTRMLSVEISAQKKIPNLRSSIDEDIIKGYWSLGFEIAPLIQNRPNNQDVGIFVQVSSGTALVGLVQGLFMKLDKEYLMPKIFVCQTQSVHPMVLKNIDETEEPSLADAIFDTKALRSPQINKIINETNGEAFALTNVELKNANEFIKMKNPNNFTYTSLLSVAGYLRAKSQYKFEKVICITSGT